MAKSKLKTDTLGQRIRSIRGGLTQAELADILRIKQAMVSRYEADKETPSPKNLLRMSRYSGKSIEWILTGKDPEGAKRKAPPKPASRKMSKEDIITLASENLAMIGTQEAEEFSELMKTAFSDKKVMKQVLDYFRYLDFSDLP